MFEQLQRDALEGIMAIRNYLDIHAESIKQNYRTKKQYSTMINSLLDALSMDHVFKDDFLSRQGCIDLITDDTGKVVAYEHHGERRIRYH